MFFVSRAQQPPARYGQFAAIIAASAAASTAVVLRTVCTACRCLYVPVVAHVLHIPGEIVWSH